MELNWTHDKKTTTAKKVHLVHQHRDQKRGEIRKSEQSDFDEVHYHSQLFVSPKVTFCIETTNSGFIQKKTRLRLLLFKRFCFVSHKTITKGCSAKTGSSYSYTNCYFDSFDLHHWTILCNYLIRFIQWHIINSLLELQRDVEQKVGFTRYNCISW